MNAPVENAGAAMPLRPLKLIPGCNTLPEVTREQLKVNVERDVPWLDIEDIKDEPLIIVAGGPSLTHRWPEILAHKGKILALNNTYRFLLERGIVPDYFMLLDARLENIRFLDHLSTHTRHFIAAQCHPAIFDRLERYQTTLYLTTLPETVELTAHINKPKIQIAGNVGTVGIKALCLAYALGFKELHLFGYDSSYEGEAHHAYQQSLNDNTQKIDVYVDGQGFITSPTFAHQASEFCAIAGELTRTYGFDIELHCDGLLPRLVEFSNRLGETPLEIREQQKYETMWTYDQYRKTAPGENHVVTAMNLFSGKSVIDFGCGTGRGAQYLKNEGYDVTGIDFASNCRDSHVDFKFIQACLWDLPWISADWGLCTDVMEHIPPEKIYTVLHGIASRVTEGAYFNISTQDDRLGTLIGRKLHLSIAPAAVWKQELEKHFSSVQMIELDGDAVFICRHEGKLC